MCRAIVVGMAIRYSVNYLKILEFSLLYYIKTILIRSVYINIEYTLCIGKFKAVKKKKNQHCREFQPLKANST